MLLALLAALAVSSSPSDVFLGMPEREAKNVKQTIQFFAEGGADWAPHVEATTPIGQDTLVMWSWPLKGTHGIGLQIYARDGQFKTRLEDSNLPSARAVVCAGRYIVGGGNTLRVWDAQQRYKLIMRKTFPDLSQFAQLRCDGRVVRMEDLASGGQLRTLLLNVPALTTAPPKYNLRLGLSALEWQTIVSNTGGQVSLGYAVTQTLRTRTGDTLVRWSSTPGLDPKGPNGLGVQVYGPGEQFQRWIPDARNIDRDFVLCGRYLVGGQNTLRVWDTEADYRIVSRKTWPSLSRSARLECTDNDFTVSIAGLRLQLPALTPAR